MLGPTGDYCFFDVSVQAKIVSVALQQFGPEGCATDGEHLCPNMEPTEIDSSFPFDFNFLACAFTERCPLFKEEQPNTGGKRFIW